MSTRTYFMTATLHSIKWAFAVPRLTEEKANISAENAIAFRLLKDRGIEVPKNVQFGIWVRLNHLELILEAQEFIGDTRKVEIPEGMKLREFRRWYCRGERTDGWEFIDMGVWA